MSNSNDIIEVVKKISKKKKSEDIGTFLSALIVSQEAFNHKRVDQFKKDYEQIYQATHKK